MWNYKRNAVLRLLTIILVVAMILPLTAGATTVQPRASAYFSEYEAYISAVGNGKVQVRFSANGTGYMDELGLMRITLKESTNNSTWTTVKTFTQSGTPSLMGYNTDYHSGYVTYQGVAGRYYKAYVCFWSGDNGSGENRYFWTSVKQAT